MITMEDISQKLDEAISLAKAGNVSKALSIFHSLFEISPKNTEVLYNLGICLNEMQDYSEAEKYLDLLIKIKPNYKNAKAALGFSFINSGKIAKAEKILLEVIKLDPKNVFALRNIGSIFAKKGNYHKALEYFLQGEKEEPKSRPIIYGIALTYFELNDFEKSIEYIRKILDQDDFDGFYEKARELSTQIAKKTFKKTDIRYDAVFYCLAAIEKFEQMNLLQIRGITAEIAILGSSGFDTSDSERHYQINSLPGEFTGIQLICYMYVGFQMLDSNIDIGFDLSKEYELAQKMFGHDGEKR
jgi:tetratricopeptide (TPR) repeat protein